MDELKIKSTLLRLADGDIVKAGTDAVVNAANERLAPGAGVCEAIFTAAGPQLDKVTRTMGGCPTGQAKITPAFNIPRPTTHIIHAVGPIFDRGNETKSRELLAEVYRSSLELATANNLKSIAFPSISTGIYRYPLEKAVPVALQTVVAYLLSNVTSLQEIHFMMWDDEMKKVYQKTLPKSGESILFYDKEKPYYEFTNFARGFEFTLDNLTWPTSEHYFQAQKFKDTPLFDEIRRAENAREVFTLAGANKDKLPDDWHQIKDDIMRKAVLAKFQAHPQLQKMLRATANKILVEDSPSDDYWGIGRDGRGKNKLGLVLMETREKLR